MPAFAARWYVPSAAVKELKWTGKIGVYLSVTATSM
jgi:hypothetical protein